MPRQAHVRFDAKNPPAIVPERSHEVAKATAHFQQVATLRIATREKAPRVEVVPNLQRFLGEPRIGANPGHLLHEVRVVGLDLNVVWLNRSRIGIHQSAAVAGDDLVSLGPASRKLDGEVVGTAQVARNSGHRVGPNDKGWSMASASRSSSIRRAFISISLVRHLFAIVMPSP